MSLYTVIHTRTLPLIRSSLLKLRSTLIPPSRISVSTYRLPATSILTLSGRRLSFINRKLYSTEPKFNGGQQIATKFRQLDGIPPNYELIYRLNFNAQLILMQVSNCLGLITIFMVVVSSLMPADETRRVPVRPKLEDEEWATKLQAIDPNTLPKPSPAEFTEVSPLQLGVMLLGLCGLMFVMVRFLRSIPIRLYTTKSGHSYAVFYSPVLINRTVKHEFVAGTVKPLPYKRQSKTVVNDSVFIDGSGRSMLLLDYCFRSQTDFDFLTGARKKLHDDEDD